MNNNLDHDPILQNVPSFMGHKLLPPCALIRKIGGGGMGAVYLGWHAKLRIPVAVKCLLRTADRSYEKSLCRFEREAQLGAILSHQNVVKVFELNSKHEVDYLVMEFVDGLDLRKLVKGRGRLPVEEAAVTTLEAARALAVLHDSGMVHRDVKPDNILATVAAEVKLADLGFARAPVLIEQAEDLTGFRELFGTPQYMAPEQWVTTRVAPSADVWALGVMSKDICPANMHKP